MRFLATIAYDGSKYNGYQKQVHGNTVQDKLEEILTSINGGSKVSVSASGRTDAGVHAYGQKIHFDIVTKVTPDSLKKAMNGLLPGDIYVKDVVKVSDDFQQRIAQGLTVQAKSGGKQKLLNNMKRVKLFCFFIPCFCLPTLTWGYISYLRSSRLN